MIDDTLSLAIFGNQPHYSDPLHVGRPNIGNHDQILEDLKDILNRRWLSNQGVYEKRFEEELKSRLGVKHCVAVSNCTMGLIIAIKAAELSGEVIMPAFTFPGTAHALNFLGITPVFCDIDPTTYQMDVSSIESLITPSTTGILAVHLFGRICDIGALEEITQRHQLKLIVDAAEAMGCSPPDRAIGGDGDAVIFSFHATKVMNSYEGGVIATNNDKIAESARFMRNFGFDGVGNVTRAGINAKMSEPSAAMGLNSLKFLDSFIETNRNNYFHYEQILGNIPGIIIRSHDMSMESNYHYVIIEVENQKFGITRDNLMAVLIAENILARSYFHPGCHRIEPYRSQARNFKLPNTDRIAESVLALPTGTSVTKSDIEFIGRVIETASQNGPEIMAKIGVI